MWPVFFLVEQISFSFLIPIVYDYFPDHEISEEFSLKIIIENPYDERVSVGVPSTLTVVITGRYAKPTSYLCALVNAYVCTYMRMPRPKWGTTAIDY